MVLLCSGSSQIIFGMAGGKNTSKATHTHTNATPLPIFYIPFSTKMNFDRIRSSKCFGHKPFLLHVTEGRCCFLQVVFGGCGQGKALGQIPKFNSWHWDVSKPQVCHGEALQQHRREAQVFYHPPAPGHSRYREGLQEGITGTGERTKDQEERE